MYRGATDSNIKIVTNGLLEYWDASQLRSYPRDGSSTWSDVSGRGKNLTLYNGTVWTSASGGGFTFDATDDYAIVGPVSTNGNIYSTSGITIAAWVYSNYFLGNRAIVFIGDPTSGSAFGPVLFVDAGGGNVNLRFALQNSSGTTGTATATNYFSYSTNQYVVGTYDQSTIRVYLNGVERATSALSGAIRFISSLYLKIGDSGTSGGDFNTWNGRIYSTKIYNRALTAIEVLSNYNATKTRFGL